MADAGHAAAAPHGPCTECGQPAAYRVITAPSLVYAQNARRCPVCAAAAAASGHLIEAIAPEAAAPRRIVVHITTDNDHQYARVRAWLESHPPDQDPHGRHYDTTVLVADTAQPHRRWWSEYDGAANNPGEAPAQ